MLMLLLLLSTVTHQLSTLFSPRIPLLAWCGIILVILFTLVVNIAMIALLRAKTQPGKAMRQPKVGGFIGASQELAKMGEVIRDPFAQERNQLDELSRLVHGLEEPSGKNSDQSPDSQDTKSQ